MDKIIEISNVSREFKVRGGKIVQALSNLNLKVDKGEVIGYIGRNGAGKSTTIKLLSGIITPSEGMITVCGFNPNKQRRKLVHRIGVMFGQRSHLVWDLPLRDSFELMGAMYSVPKNTMKERLDWLIEMLEIGSIINQQVRTLSLGQRTRGELVATLLHGPELVLLDEPTIGLDIYIRDRLLSTIMEFKKRMGTTFMLTSHNLDDIERVCNRIVIIESGRIIHEGSVEDLLKKQTILVTVYFNEPILAGKYIDINGIVLVSEEPGKLSVELEPDIQVGILLERLKSLKVIDIKIQERRLETVVKQFYDKTNKNTNL